jgi:hypothetical protein
MTLKGHLGKNDDIGGATGTMAAAGSQAESRIAGAVLGASGDIDGEGSGAGSEGSGGSGRVDEGADRIVG